MVTIGDGPRELSIIERDQKAASHHHIEWPCSVGNPPAWVWPREQVIASIEARTNTFFVLDPRSGKRADVGVVREAGKAPYLRTYADGDWNDNLLSLQQCPVR